MKLRKRLILSFLLCGLTSVAVVGVANIVISCRSNRFLQEQASKDFEHKAQDQLVALRDVKKSQIELYFQTIGSQAQTLAESRMVIDAMRDLGAAFRNYRSDMKVTPEKEQQLRVELQTYYKNDFTQEFAKQNLGKTVETGPIFEKLDSDSIALQHAYIRANQNPLGSKHLLDSADSTSTYGKLHAVYHPILRNFLTRFGYYDIFLVDAETGDIVYTVFKELDFTTSLKDGPYASTNIAEAFRQANESTDKTAVHLVDFKPYGPSYGAPASFIAAPIYEGDKKIGILMFQMPVDRVNDIMGLRSAMGETGETYLVGPDFLMRSNSHRDKENRSIVNSFRHPEKGCVATPAVKAALAGESKVELAENYLGDRVVSAYAPITLLGLKWAVMAEISENEAYAAAKNIAAESSRANTNGIIWGAGLSALMALVVLVFAYISAKQILKPVNDTIETLKDIAQGEGDLTRRLDATRKDELGDLSRWFNQFVERVHDVIVKIVGDAATLAQASTNLSTTATQLSAGATQSKSQSATVSSAAEEMSINMKNMARSTEQMSTGMKSVATSVEQMTATISEIAQSAERSASVAAEATKMAEVSNAKVAQLGDAADEIGKVIEVIQDIAEQTNLLALNATIEAARAGEAGKGFAVVATEVKELAKQTASATDDIRRRIEAIQSSTGEAVHSIAEISQAIRNVNEVANTIASAVEEQSITTKQIAKNVGDSASAADIVARGVNESASASEEITRNIVGIDEAAKETTEVADKTRTAGDELNLLARSINGLVGQFKVDQNARQRAAIEKTPTRRAEQTSEHISA
jgi:methyl-accepting chemotaxis protein